MGKLKWYAAGGGIAQMGPYESQVEAWEALRYAEDIEKKTRCKHPKDARVWPER